MGDWEKTQTVRVTGQCTASAGPKHDIWEGVRKGIWYKIFKMFWPLGHMFDTTEKLHPLMKSGSWC